MIKNNIEAIKEFCIGVILPVIFATLIGTLIVIVFVIAAKYLLK